MIPRHLLTLRELSSGEIEALLDDAQAAQDGAVPDLRGAVVAMLFYEPSTRTEMSFELAARRTGADVLRCDVEHSSVRKGESLVDTVRTFASLGTDVLVLRHHASGAPALAARHVACAVVNAGDGMHEHPTQGLVDLLTVRQIKGRIDGLRIAIVGDIVHSRVVRSAAWGFTRLGASIVLAGPATLLPAAPPAPGVELTTSLEAAVSGADVVMALRLQRERQAAGEIPTAAEYTRLYAGGGVRAALRDRPPGRERRLRPHGRPALGADPAGGEAERRREAGADGDFLPVGAAGRIATRCPRTSSSAAAAWSIPRALLMP
jgi:aspartate carbamoyltransferase catalytic subunit